MRGFAASVIAVLVVAAAGCGVESATRVVPDLPISPLPTLPPISTPPPPTPEVPSLTASPRPTAGPERDCDVSFTAFPTGVEAELGSITSGPDGALWFTAGEQIGRMTTSGTVKLFPLPRDVVALGITSGPDGALWFTDVGTTSIGRMSTNGSVRTFATPTRTGNPIGVGGAANPMAITTGPDGALWFTESAADKIGRITTAGVIQEFTLPSYDRVHANPQGIATGPDGWLWFAQPLDESLGAIHPKTHEIREFPIDAEDSMPSDVVSAHGAIWFSEPTTGAIGRMTPDGENRLFPLESGAAAWHVGTGRDANVWYMDQRNGRVGSMTPDGKRAEFAASSKHAFGTDGYPAIVRGPDGATWFMQTQVSKIGRVGCAA